MAEASLELMPLYSLTRASCYLVLYWYKEYLLAGTRVLACGYSYLLYDMSNAIEEPVAVVLYWYKSTCFAGTKVLALRHVVYDGGASGSDKRDSGKQSTYFCASKARTFCNV